MRLQGGLSVERMCKLAEVSRAGFYRYLRQGWEGEEEVALRSAVQEVVFTEELRAQGLIVNHKRVARVMREDNLLAARRDWFSLLTILFVLHGFIVTWRTG